MRKKLKRWEFSSLLYDFKIDKDGKLPFIDNFISSEKHSCLGKNLWHYLFFLKSEYESFRNTAAFGLINFQEYLNSEYPPAVEPIEQLENLFKEYESKEKFSAETILKIIDDIKNHPEG